MRKQIYITLVLMLNSTIYATGMKTVSGKVVSESGNPLEYVNVYFMDDLSGDVTDVNGMFEIKTKLTGIRELMTTFIGYKKSVLKVNVGDNGLSNLEIQMFSKAIEMKEVSVQASSFSIAEDEGTTFRALDIVTTAGAAADVIRAVHTFAGVSTVDDGAGIFVRGGDVNETRMLLDGGCLKHPYKFESPTGGYFGTFSPFLLSGTFFSSGGFSAQYGNALSGVMAMESLGMPQKKEFNLGLGLAAFSASGSVPVVEDKFGIRFSGNLSQTKMLFKLNGGLDEFSRVPVSNDGNLSLHYRYHPNGMLKMFVFASNEEMGVDVITPTLRDDYVADETNRFYLINGRHAITPDLLMDATLSINQFEIDQNVGVFDLETTDRSVNIRMDLRYSLNPAITLKTGWEHENLKTSYLGVSPYDPNDLEGKGQLLTFDGSTLSEVSGGFVESEIRITKSLACSYGHRLDYQHQQSRWTSDPRFSIAWQPVRDHVLKFAAGRYHQFPEAYYYDQYAGNPDLKPMQALHAILGYEYVKNAMMVRIEGYYKDYENLILNDGDHFYNSNGHGYARGVDFFLKKDSGMLTGWASYSFLQSKRKEYLYDKIVPTDYDITHNVKVASKFELTPLLGLSVSYRYATGRPFHVGYGRWNSERGSAYHKLDFSASYLYSFFDDNLTIFYVSIANILDRKNVINYTYSPDYETVYTRHSVNGRAVYFGFTFNF